jgi:hypothetical protein
MNRAVVVFAAILCLPALLPAQAPSVLDRVLPPGEVFCVMNPGCAWAALVKAGVPIGLEDPRPLGHDQTHPTFKYGGLTVGDVLTKAVEAEPDFEYREINGIVVLRTKAAWNDRDNLLNQPVASPYVLSDVDLTNAMFLVTGHPSAPEPPTGKLFSLRLENATLLDVLNNMVMAVGHGIGWQVSSVYLPTKTLTYLQFSNGTGRYGGVDFVERKVP